MITKTKEIVNAVWQWVKKYQTDIILVLGVILISLLSFATGYIIAKQQEKPPIIFENYSDL